MKYVIATLALIVAFFIADMAHASAHLSLKPYQNHTVKEQGAIIGFDVEESLLGPVKADFGGEYNAISKQEVKTELPAAYNVHLGLLVRPLSALELGAGYMVERVRHQEESEQISYLKISAKLW